MNPPDDPLFINPFRRYVRNFLVLAAVFFAVGVAAVLVTALPVAKSFGPGSGGQTAVILTIILCLPLTVSMLVSVLFTLPSVKLADRTFAEFREGHYLARWNYSPEEWRAYVEGQDRLPANIKWWIFAVVWGVTWIAGVFGGWSLGNTLLTKLAWSSLLPGLVLFGGVLTLIIVRLVIHRRCQRQRAAFPQTYVGKNAVYCGSEFRFWGARMLALKGVEILSGPPRALQFNIGLSPAGQAAFSAVGTAGFAVGRPMPLSFGMQLVVPIPSGAEAEAAQLVRTFTNQVREGR